MASCKGMDRAKKISCLRTLEKCNICGNIGCKNTDCTNIAFHNGKCLKCGGTRRSTVR